MLEKVIIYELKRKKKAKPKTNQPAVPCGTSISAWETTLSVSCASEQGRGKKDFSPPQPTEKIFPTPHFDKEHDAHSPSFILAEKHYLKSLAFKTGI